MEPLRTLLQRASATMPHHPLPNALTRRYDGELDLPESGPGGRPYVFANFVATLDGVVSFAEPGHAGGGEISGNNEADRFIMGLLRAHADAVVVGSGTLHGDAGHIRTAPYIYPKAAAQYADMRHRLGRTQTHPLNVIVSASGHVDLSEPTFHTPDLRAVIATSAAGAARLAHTEITPGVEVLVVPPPRTEPAGSGGFTRGSTESEVDPAGLLVLLARDYGVRLVLHEGGPHLFGAFLAAQLVDELFLTLAPQLAGRDAHSPRPALVEDHAFVPGAAPWANLVSIKQSGDHVFLRYQLRQTQPG